eukprot:TRINITY_DN12286_c0_g1_i4.p1 TRINITY_DN12286_c0_g1~~TRINITY_DN12286_c0_g1_i4.p1  ORF type:complete len:287 (+),score=32.44 TRINITY_DN12286_c0_g1_i4:309-1169(+)
MASVNWMADVQRSYNSYSCVGRETPNSIESQPEEEMMATYTQQQQHTPHYQTDYNEETYGYYATQSVHHADEVLVSKYDELGMHEYDIVDSSTYQSPSSSNMHQNQTQTKHQFSHTALPFNSTMTNNNNSQSVRIQYLNKTEEAVEKLMKLRVSLNGELWRNAEQVSASIEELALLFVRVSDSLSMEELKGQQMYEHMQMQQSHIDALRQEVIELRNQKRLIDMTDVNRQTPQEVSAFDSYFMTQEEQQSNNSETRCNTESPESYSNSDQQKMSVFAQPFVPGTFM